MLFTLLYIHNFNLFFIVIMLTSINDVIAYMLGSYFKGPKIIPVISPNKTWSGTISSYVISVLLLFYFLLKLANCLLSLTMANNILKNYLYNFHPNKKNLLKNDPVDVHL